MNDEIKFNYHSTLDCLVSKHDYVRYGQAEDYADEAKTTRHADHRPGSLPLVNPR